MCCIMDIALMSRVYYMCCIMNIALILLYVMDIKFPWLVLEISILLTATFYTLLLYTPPVHFLTFSLGN